MSMNQVYLNDHHTFVELIASALRKSCDSHESSLLWNIHITHNHEFNSLCADMRKAITDSEWEPEEVLRVWETLWHRQRSAHDHKYRVCVLGFMVLPAHDKETLAEALSW